MKLGRSQSGAAFGGFGQNPWGLFFMIDSELRRYWPLSTFALALLKSGR
jgi:hypothetical protein